MLKGTGFASSTNTDLSCGPRSLTLGPVSKSCTVPFRVGDQLGALGTERVMAAMDEEPEGTGIEPKGPRTVVDKQYLVVMRHGQRIDEVQH